MLHKSEQLGENETYWTEEDTYMVKNTFKAAKLAANGVLQACLNVWEGKWDTAFALVRPPGHHAQALTESVEGFCIINSVAVATKELLKKGAK